MRVVSLGTLLVLWVAPLFTAQAQVVNIESRRLHSSTLGWSGQGEFGYAYIQNQNAISNLNTRLNFLHHTAKHNWLLLADVSLIQSNRGDFENAGYQHIRYQYAVNAKLSYEAFTQIQFSKQMRLYPRWILGAGPRYAIVEKDSVQVYAGGSLFIEHEQLRDPELVNSSERLNMYLSVVFHQIPNVVIDLFLMYQPRLIQPSDRRLQSEIRFDFPISNHLQCRFAATVFNDTRPPSGVPQTFSSMRSSIIYSF